MNVLPASISWNRDYYFADSPSMDAMHSDEIFSVSQLVGDKIDLTISRRTESIELEAISQRWLWRAPYQFQALIEYILNFILRSSQMTVLVHYIIISSNFTISPFHKLQF